MKSFWRNYSNCGHFCFQVWLSTAVTRGLSGIWMPTRPKSLWLTLWRTYHTKEATHSLVLTDPWPHCGFLRFCSGASYLSVSYSHIGLMQRQCSSIQSAALAKAPEPLALFSTFQDAQYLDRTFTDVVPCGQQSCFICFGLCKSTSSLINTWIASGW